MLKLIVLVLALGIGFGGGVLWSQHHPTQAASVSAQEEQQIATMKDKIHQLLAKHHGSAVDTSAAAPGTPDTSAAAPAGNSDTKQVDSGLQELDNQLDSLKAKLSN